MNPNQYELFDPTPYIDPNAPQSWEGLPHGWTWREGLKEIEELLDNRVLADNDTKELIAFYGVMLTCLLLHKNRRYGNSATHPIEVFAKNLTPRQRLAVRMDDKINRMVHGEGTSSDDKEDPRPDLAGYILLDIVAEHLENRGK
jgi:hypothetical protein